MNSHPSIQFEMSFKHLVFKLFTKQNIWKISLGHHHGQCRQTFFSGGDSGAGGDGDIISYVPTLGQVWCKVL